MATTSRSVNAFNSHNPVTSEPVGSYPIYSASMVAEVVDHARFASAAWVKLGFSGRKRVLLAWSTYIINNVDQIAALVSLETGKPKAMQNLRHHWRPVTSVGPRDMQKTLCARPIALQGR